MNYVMKLNQQLKKLIKYITKKKIYVIYKW